MTILRSPQRVIIYARMLDSLPRDRENCGRARRNILSANLHRCSGNQMSVRYFGAGRFGALAAIVLLDCEKDARESVEESSLKCNRPICIFVRGRNLKPAGGIVGGIHRRSSYSLIYFRSIQLEHKKSTENTEVKS